MGGTVLHISIKNKCFEVAQRIIERSVEVGAAMTQKNAVSACIAYFIQLIVCDAVQENLTPLHCAILSGDARTILSLAQQLSIADINDVTEVTCLAKANVLRYNNMSLMWKLMQYGETALHLWSQQPCRCSGACAGCSKQPKVCQCAGSVCAAVCSVLLKGGADLSLKTKVCDSA
jgi:hypothetical protein